MLLDWPLWKRVLAFPLVLVFSGAILFAEVLQMRYVFKAMQAFWIMSPVLFIGLRLAGIFNYGADWAVFMGLSLVSFITVFLTHGR